MLVPIWLIVLTAFAFGACVLITALSVFAWLGSAAEIADLRARSITLRLAIEHDRWERGLGRHPIDGPRA